jgi:hypothetical protein
VVSARTDMYSFQTHIFTGARKLFQGNFGEKWQCMGTIHFMHR